ncbi:MAG: HEAT repeat domain-containing protein [Verrucomicrobia bacterium]|nr:HEAT repeat domain-containing protein [Verrucomicrobiota bacterium]
MPHRSSPVNAAAWLIFGSVFVCFFAACSRPAADSKPVASAANVTAPATAPASPTATFKFATQSLTVPAGYTVELVAGPPLVDRPISLAFDELGRLYATDSSGLSDKADKQFEAKPHRIVRLEDTDGDGRFEKNTVFADRMMFPQGALFHRGSLYVAAPPHLWKLTDTDGDGVADQREVWYDGKTLTGCANDLHGPYLGPDGWFYFTKGAFAEQRHTLGNGRSFTTRAAHIFRSRADGSGFEPVLTGGMDNPVGVAFSPTGERILCGTFFQIPAAGKRDGLIHAIYGGVYGKQNDAASGHARTGDLMPIMTHMGAAAPCGSTFVQSPALGGPAGALFVCYFNLRKIVRHDLVPDGATFATRDTDFLTSDSLDFHPTDVLEDADGSLLVADTGGWYKICCPTSQLTKPDVLGGIYRIRRTVRSEPAERGAPAAPSDPRGLKIAWARLTPAATAQLLADPRLAVRERALDTLARLGGSAVAPLAKLLATAPAADTRRQAVWALARIEGEPARAALRTALDDRDPSVVQTALQNISLHRDHAALPQLTPLLAHADPAVVRLAAEALGRIGDPTAVSPLLAAIARLPAASVTTTGAPEPAAARVLEHALIYALIEIARPEELLRRLAAADSPRITRAALVALDQMEPRALPPAPVVALLESTLPVLRRTAEWIAAQHPEWGGSLADYFVRRLAAPTLPDATAAELRTQLVPLARSPSVQAMLADRAADSTASIPARRLALQVMAAASLKETPAAWFAALASATGSAELCRDALATARALPLPKSGADSLLAALARVARDPAAPAENRVAAAAITAPSLAPVEPALLDFILAQLAADRPSVIRNAAATALAKLPLAPPQRLQLADTLRTVGPVELPKLLPAFERSPSEELGRRLVASLSSSAGLPGLRANVVQALFAKYPAAVQAAAAPLLARLNADATRQNARVDELLAAATDGDVRRGQLVFASEKAACLACHKVGYAGGTLGPDLTNIGRIRTARELLEAVVFPSATFVRGYEPFLATTKSGEQLGGLLRAESADDILLATGPDTERRLARADLTDLQPSNLSPMPPGLDTALSRQELADLLAFLVSRK